MRRLSRIAQPSRPALATCRQCRCNIASLRSRGFSTGARVLEEEQIPFTERLRRRIHGTDNPPGYKDPYDKSSGLNTPNEALESKSVAKTPLTVASAANPKDIDPNYEPAKSWHGLESIGDNSDEWRKSQVTYRFQGYISVLRLGFANCPGFNHL
jgi:hypothetical protein